MPRTEKTPSDEPGEPPRPFADFLLTHARGDTHSRLSTDLQKLTRAVVDTGKKGTLQLTITVSPLKNTDRLEVTDAVIAKIPELPRRASIFFADADGNLTRDDPNVEPLFIPDTEKDHR